MHLFIVVYTYNEWMSACRTRLYVMAMTIVALDIQLILFILYSECRKRRERTEKHFSIYDLYYTWIYIRSSTQTIFQFDKTILCFAIECGFSIELPTHSHSNSLTQQNFTMLVKFYEEIRFFHLMQTLNAS